ncbi:MAG TPA: rod shape-determining protein RodA [Actinomycetota bacterium]|nr:rod shape-determining protein RodA [Actinomycetota bacterium]
MAGQGTYLGRTGTFGRQRVMAGPLSAKHPVRHVDLSLLAAAMALAVIGCVAVYSATRPHLLAVGTDPNYYLKRQLTYVALALIILLIAVMFDYRQLRTLAPLAYLGGLAGLLLVLTPIGQRQLGAQRWITVGILQIQPSELMKLVLIVALAALWAERGTDDGGPKVLIAVALAAIPAALVYLQPDLGTVLVLLFVSVTIIVVAGARLRWLGVLAAGGAVVIFLALHFGFIHQYQLARITGFLNQKSAAACQTQPNASGCSAAYNLGQSKIAVSSGGLTGKGLLKGTQTNLDYVPENQTDFIFTVIGEETGFLGSLLVIGLLAFLIWRALRIAVLARDQFGTRLAMGVAAMLAFQLFINVGMTIGIVPIVGIPLPFISYGGSSLLTSFCAVGILMNIHMRRFV